MGAEASTLSHTHSRSLTRHEVRTHTCTRAGRCGENEIGFHLSPPENAGGERKKKKEGRNPPKTTQLFDICSPASVNRLDDGDGRGEAAGARARAWPLRVNLSS